MRDKKMILKRKIVSLWQNSGMFVVFVVLFVLSAVFVPFFFTWRNMIAVALSVSMVGMVACTMLFCLASGDFDLSVESIVVFSGVLAAIIISKSGSIFLGIVCGVAAGGLIGLFNGVVISKLKVNALIATLATMQIVRGFSFIVCNGKSVTIKISDFFLLGTGRFLLIPIPVWITILCFVTFGLLLNKTVFGRNVLAMGGNEKAARLAGVAVDKTKIVIFALQGLMAGFAGVVLASRMGSGQPNASFGFSLDVISACVLGGVSLTGGVGTITGVLVGVLIMGTVQNAMDLLNIDPFYQYVARGSILLAAVLLDKLKRGQFT